MIKRKELIAKITPWKVLSSKIELDSPWIRVRADSCEMGNGKIIEPYYVVDISDWVHVLAFNSKMEVMVLYQYRHGSKEICTEIVAGTVDDGEEPLVTAERELMEETGCKATRIEFIGSYNPNPANQSNLLHNYVAFDVEQVAEPNFDESEHIEFEFMALEDLAELLDRGVFREALFIHSLMVGLRHAGIELPSKNS